MNVTDLIRAFSTREKLPVDVNDILACLRENGNDDNIEFIGVDLDPEILQGAIKVFYVRNGVYSEPEKWVNIYYDRGSSIDRQRMVCCKELVHLLDPKDAYTQSENAIEQLAEKMGLPPEMQDPTSDGFATNVDRLAEFRATALLMPKAARDLLLDAYRSKKLTISDIARVADIPTRYAGFAMSDVWQPVFDLLAAH
jgi:Zn-dependent peptidase ImmA (M78 family)